MCVAFGCFVHSSASISSASARPTTLNTGSNDDDDSVSDSGISPGGLAVSSSGVSVWRSMVAGGVDMLVLVDIYYTSNMHM